MPRAPGAERGQPGLQGPRGRAGGQHWRPGSGAGPPGGGRGAGPPGRGHRFWGTKFPPGARGPLAGVLPADLPLPGEVTRFPGGLFRAWWTTVLPPPPWVLASLFQIMLRLAFWWPSFLKAPVPLGDIPTAGRGWAAGRRSHFTDGELEGEK